MSELKVGIVGCAGRMGRMLLAAVEASPDCELAGGCEAPGGAALGRDLGSLIGLDPLGLVVGDDPRALFEASDVVIDFTAPAASLRHAELAAESGTALVIGTTGLDADQLATIAAAGERTVIVRAPNMSLGINLLLALVERVARSLDDDYDIEVVEMHHRHKVDAPSGTALGLGEAAAAGRDVALEAVAQRVRDGHTGARRRGDIGFATLRGGDVIGDHSVIFAAEGERR
jgi:4-hydroxy-tetrahydrodipicolinate reductase